MPPKRNHDSIDNTAQVLFDNIGEDARQIKTESLSQDFSTSVKKRLATSSRTGQACDRCKIRKIRCDGLLGGCSPCLQNATECRTTDRITGRAAPRGYVEGLESTNAQLQGRIHELEQQLRQKSGFSEDGIQNNAEPASWHGQPTSSNAYTMGLVDTTSNKTQETETSQTQPLLRTGFSGEHHLGIASTNSQLTSFRGTALSILGMEIDIADFTSEDMDEPMTIGHTPLYNKSYQAFMQSTLNVNPKINKVELPGREEGLTYARWYFRVLNPFLPILHGPSFMAVLTQIYDDPSFRPTVAQTVMVHMVFAMMFFQYAVRNWENSAQQMQLNHQSNLHYHYSLGMFYQLTCSHTLEDAQAMTLICAHLRNFPKPGASWVLTCSTLGLAIELGLHRSAKSKPDLTDPLKIEIRKRVWWGLLAIHVTLSGKLGRPCYIRMDDFDIEIPDVEDDEISSDSEAETMGVRSTRIIGQIAYKLVPAFMELYATIYAVRRNPDNYISNVKKLEGRIRQWSSDLADDECDVDIQKGGIFALYTEAWKCEFRLLLYHPSSSLTQDVAFNKESMRICLESARSLLNVVNQIKNMKSLDTTWYNCSVYVMAITTTLFAQWEKRYEITQHDVAALRKEMDTWLDIMGDVGHLLGSGTRLREATSNVIDGTIGLLSHSLATNSGFVNQANAKQERNTQSPTSRPPNPRVNSITHHSPAHSVHRASITGTSYSRSSTERSPTQLEAAAATYMPTEHSMSQQQQTQYPPTTQYPSYHDIQQHQHQQNSYSTSHHASFSYASSGNANSNLETPLLDAFAAEATQQQSLQPKSFQSQPTRWQSVSHPQHSIRPSSSTHNLSLINSGKQSWQQWTNTMTSNLEPQDCYATSALMQLGSAQGHGQIHMANGMGNGNGGVGPLNNGGGLLGTSIPMTDVNGAHAAIMAMAHGHDSSTSIPESHGLGTGIQWPLNIFDVTHGGG